MCFVVESNPALSIIKLSPFDNPTEKILLKCEASKNERKRNETREELQKIQERISFSIDQYEYSSRKALELLEESSSNGETQVEVMEDPAQLYEILSDARRRAQYKQKFTVFIVGYEEKCENREKLLSQVEDFFMETKASNMTRLVDEISSDHDEYNFDDALTTMSNALETTSGALAKLQKLQQDISQVFAVYAAFPNDKKGRKKLEKALLKAQEDCNKLSSSLVGVQDELEQTKEKAKKLQKQLDSKNSEIGKLQKSVEEIKILKETNQSLQKQLKEANELLVKTKQEKEKLQKTELSAASVSISPEYLKLKAELERQKELNEQLSSEHQAKEAALISEIETVKENYEAEITELRDKFEEQMKSLMDLDDIEYEDQHSSNEAIMDDNMDYPGGAMMEEEIALNLDTTLNEKVPVEQPVDDDIALLQDTVTKENVEDPPTSHDESEDFINNQKQLEEELKETKHKSKKMIASLKAQIMDQQSKHEAAIHDHKKEAAKLKSQYDELVIKREQERSQYENVNTEKERIEHELSQLLLTKDEQARTIADLQAQLDVLQQQVALFDANQGKVSCSVQWETPVHTHSNTPAVTATPMLSQANTPLPLKMSGHDTTGQESTFGFNRDYEDGSVSIVPMHEVPLENGKTSGKTSRARQQSASSQIALTTLEEEKKDIFDTSTLSSELSSTSMSPNVSPSLRQRHGSEPPITAVNPPVLTMDHPVVKECHKVYKSVVQFKYKMVALLSKIGSPQSAGELKLLQEIKDDEHSSANAHTQVTLMRHNLLMTINTIEQVLNEEMKRLAKPEVVVANEGDNISQASEEELIKLRAELRNAKHTVKVNSEEHHRMMRDLKDANENLKAEIAYLKKMATKNQQETSELIMFTRLDSDRNSQSLKSALQSNKISDDVYSQTVQVMEEYGSISSQQFVNLAQQYKHCMVINQIMHQLEGLNPAKREVIQERIAQYSRQKSRCLSAKLDDLRAQKNQLANMLTSTLSDIEDDTGVFLIKPIIRSKNVSLSEPSIRNPAKQNASVRYSVDKRWPVTKPRHHHDRDTKTHNLYPPKLQHINTLNRDSMPDVSSRHTKLQYIDLLHHHRKITTEVRPEAIIVYGSEPPSKRRARLTETEKQWNVDESVSFRPSSGSIRNHHDDSSTMPKSKTSVLPPINVPSDYITA